MTPKKLILHATEFLRNASCIYPDEDDFPGFTIILPKRTANDGQISPHPLHNLHATTAGSRSVHAGGWNTRRECRDRKSMCSPSDEPSSGEEQRRKVGLVLSGGGPKASRTSASSKCWKRRESPSTTSWGQAWVPSSAASIR